MARSRLAAPRTAARLAALLAASALLHAGEAAGEETAEDDGLAPLRARLERLEALRAGRPGDGILAFYAAMTRAALGRKQEALADLRGLVGRRLGLVPAPGTGFEGLWGDPEFEAVRAQLAADEPRTPDAPVRLALADAGLVPEGVAWDGARRRFLLGSVARHAIVAVDGRGRARPFSAPGDGLDAVLGLHVDARRGHLLAVTTNALERSAAAGRRNAVVRYPLAGGRPARLEAPEALQLNDVAAAPDGTVYATDSQGGTLFRAAPGAAALVPFGPAGSLPGANGVAVAPDGAVYVAITTGVARADPRDGAARRLPQPDDVVTGAMDGLYWHAGDLVGVQNLTNPGRVVRLALADGGRRIDGLTVLQSHHHAAFDEPTTGAVVGDALVVIANSNVSRYQPDGSLREPERARPPRLVAVPLRR